MKVYKVLAIVVLLAVIVAEGFLFGFTADDSFVTYRYVQNIVEGNGYVYNPGDTPMEYTHSLWLLLHVPFVMLELPVEIVSKVLGILSGLLLSLIFYLLVRRHIEKNIWQIASLLTLFLLTNISVLFYSVSGSETIFFAMLIMALFWSIDIRQWVVVDIIFALVLLTRPEGFLLLIPYLISVVKGEGWSWKSLMVVFPVLLLTGYLLYRFGYFTGPFPQVFVSRFMPNMGVGQFLSEKSMIFVGEMALWSLKSLVLGMVGVFALSGIVKSWKEEVPMLAVLILLFVVIWFHGADTMVFSKNFVPAFAPVLYFSGIGLDGLFRQIEMAKQRKKIFLASASLILCINMSFSGYYIYKLNMETPIDTAISNVHKQVGRFIKEYSNPWDVMATDEKGALAYYSELKILDVSITNGKASDNQEVQKANSNDLLKQEPRFILLNSHMINGEEKLKQGQELLYQEMMNDGNYFLLKECELNEKIKWLIFERNLFVASK